eukprot:Colp12_sorted_trinity150504_noHs@7210
MIQEDLLLDPMIRDWVLIPLVLVVLLVGVLRHNVTVLIAAEKKTELQSVVDNQVLLSSRLWRANNGFVPKAAFLKRKGFFNDTDAGVLKPKDRPAAPNPMADPTMMVEMMKGNLSMVASQVIIGGWVNYFFTGFVTTKVPFPLTVSFKQMLQRGVDLPSLNPSWVSSLSWYFLIMFGLRGINTIILGANNDADDSKMLQQQMSGGMAGGAPDMNKVYQAEREFMELATYDDKLADVEASLLR